MSRFTRLELVRLDIQHGARSLARRPALLVVAVLSLALGIGATTTLYSVVDTLLIHDVTARAPERLVSFPVVSYPTYEDVRDSGVFEQLAAGNQCGLRWRDGDRTRDVITNCLSANFFEVVGVEAAAGRVFSSREAAPELNPRMAVISDRFWRRSLESDPNVIGRVLTLNDTPFTVIGVLPPTYRAIQGWAVHPDVFVPFNTTVNPNLLDRRTAVMSPIGRLAEGRTLQQTQQALMIVLDQLAQRFPDVLNRPQAPPALVPVSGLAKYGQSSEGRTVLGFSAVLSVVAVLILVIACANVAGLLLVQGVARRREIAVRLAIGAARIQIIRQCLIETAIIAAAGTAAGIGLAVWTAKLLENVAIPGVPVAFSFSPDWRFVAAATGVGVVATLISGVVPALTSSRTELSGILQTSGRSLTPRLRLRSLMVTTQIAVSVVLLSAAFVFVRNLVHVLNVDPGFDAEHTLWFDLSTDRGMSVEERLALRDVVYRELESHQAVESVSWAWYLPFNFTYAEPLVRRADASETRIRATEQGIGPGYLTTMRIPLLAGREFDWNDLRPLGSVPRPVIVNEAFARAVFADPRPIGERLVHMGRDGSSETPLVIIGVSANTSFRGVGEKPVPLLQSVSAFRSSLVVRVSGSPTAAALDLSRTIQRNTRGADVSYYTTLEQRDRGIWPARAATVLLAVLAAMGLILALVGLSGLAIYDVKRRLPEIGLRVALGATAGRVIGMMLRDGLILVGMGAAAGIIGVAVISGFLTRFLVPAISPLDPVALGGMLTTLSLTGVISIWLCIRRAAQVNPSVCLAAD